MFNEDVINIISELMFINSCNPGLVGTCLFGYDDMDKNIEIINFYRALGKKVHPNFHNSFLIGDTRITNVFLDVSMFRAFTPEIVNGVILYDPANVLSEIMTNSIIEGKKHLRPSNGLTFEYSFIKSLIDNVSLNNLREKDDIEKYNALVNIFDILISNNKFFDYIDFNKSITSYSNCYAFNGIDKSTIISILVDAIKKSEEKKMVKRGR